MREIELELKQGKDPYFKHVYVFQHPTPKRRGLALLLLLLLIGSGAAALYTLRPDLPGSIYVASREALSQWYEQISHRLARSDAAPPPTVPPPPASARPLPTTVAVATGTDAVEVGSSPADVVATPDDVEPSVPDSASQQPPALPEPLPDSAPLPDTAPVPVADSPATPQAIEALDLPVTANAQSTVVQVDSPVAVVNVANELPVAAAGGSTATETVSVAQPLLDKGLAHVSNNQLYEPARANAADVYRALLKQDPHAAKRLLETIMLNAYQQAQAHNEQGEFSAAEKLFRQTQNLAPQHEVLDEMRRILAETLMAQAENQIGRGLLVGEQDSAYASYQKLQQLSPSSSTGENMRQRLLSALQDKASEQIDRKRYTTPQGNNAFDTYRLMLRITPNNAEALEGLKLLASKYAWLATRQIERGRSKQALEFIERGLEIQPTDADLLSLQKSLNKPPEDPFLRLLNQAKQHISAGRLTAPPGNNAYDLYQQVLQVEPTHPDAQQGLHNIADVYAQKAKVERAKGQLDSAQALVAAGLQVLPGHQELQRIQAEVDGLKRQ